MAKGEAEVRLSFAKDEVEAMRNLMRELHETIQEAKLVHRELLEAKDSLQGQVDSIVIDRVAENMEALSAATQKAIDDSTESVFKRFDELFERLTHGLEKGKRHKRKSLIDIVEEGGQTSL